MKFAGCNDLLLDLVMIQLKFYEIWLILRQVEN